jgi:hypothetical protein
MVMSAAALTLGLAGCSEKEEKKVVEIADAGPAEEEGPRFGLKWGSFSDHPARTAVENCHLVDDVELNLLRYVTSEEDFVADEVAPIFGEEIDQEADEFEKKRQRDAVAAKAAAVLDELEGELLCVRREIVVGEYDFEAEGFGLSKDALPFVFDDLSASAERFVTRLETKTMTRRPEGFEFPSVLMLAPVPSHLAVPESQAESILEQLPVTKPEDRDEKSKESTNRSVKRFGSVFSRMEPEAVEAAIHAEEHVPEGKEDRPVGEFFREIEDDLRELSSGRKTDAILVFRPLKSFSQESEEQDTTVKLKISVGALSKLVAFTPDGEVFGVLPHAAKEQANPQGERLDIDREIHDPLLEKVCRRGVDTQVETKVQDGELVDIRTPICRRCPEGASESWGRPTLQNITFASFTHPGAVEAVVRTSGCEPMSEGGGGITLLEQLADGQWRRLSYTAGPFYAPEVVRAPSGRDLLVYRSEQVSGGEASGSVSMAAPTAEKMTGESLFPIYDNRATCSEDYLIVEPTKSERADLDNDGVLDMTFKVAFHQGTREGRRCDFGDDDGIGKGETLEVSFLARNDKLVLDDGSKQVFAKIENAVQGVQ